MNKALNRRHEAAIVELETLYIRFRTQPRLSVKDILQATWLQNRIAMLTPELYVMFSGILFLLLTTGAFAPHVYLSESTRLVFVIAIMVLAVLVPLCVIFVFSPLHFLAGLSLYVVNLFMLPVASILVTSAAMYITLALTGLAVTASIGIFFAVYGTLSLGTILVLYRNNNRICYHCFKRRYPRPQLEKVISEHHQGELQAMTAQDHYVLFISSKGEQLQRITLTEAINMVPKDSGLRVHRSHWVAKSQILDLVQEQQKYVVVLRNGMHLPVGKAKIEAVRALL